MRYRIEYAEESLVVEESVWTMVINDRPWVTLLCTPEKIEYLTYGFLANEGVITGPEDVTSLEIVKDVGSAIHVQLRRDDVRLPRERTITSGCVGGITFYDLVGKMQPLDSALSVTHEQVFSLMGAMRDGAVHYQRTRGLHCSALADENGILALAEDIGRHNTLDKIRGECLVRGIETEDRIVLTTGRLSSEMLYKAMRMGTPIAVSRSTPTNLSIRLAQHWGITLIGYVRGRRMRIYTGRERVITPEIEEREAHTREHALTPC